MPGPKARFLMIFDSPVVATKRLKTKELSASSLLRGCPKGRPFFCRTFEHWKQKLVKTFHFKPDSLSFRAFWHIKSKIKTKKVSVYEKEFVSFLACVGFFVAGGGISLSGSGEW